MDVHVRTHVAFHLTGRTIAPDLDPVDHLALRPALLAAYRDLTTLRYDFPIVLRHGEGRPPVESLSGLVDAALRTLADDDAIERLSIHALRLEREIRALTARGDGGSLSALWDSAALRAGAMDDEAWRDSVQRLRAAVGSDGDVLECDGHMPAALFRHLWAVVQAEKARRFHHRVDVLRLKLSDILRADFVRSPAGRSADALRASFGSTHEDAFDFDAMAGVVGQGAPVESLSAVRRRRIERLLHVLDTQQFYGKASILDARGAPPPLAAAGAHLFIFDTCAAVLAAYQERAPQVAELARAVASAELEAKGEYRDSHDIFFGVGSSAADGPPLDPEELALFPDYLLTLSDAALTPIEQTTLLEMIGAGLPVKVLLQTDDLLDEPSIIDAPIGAGAHARQLVHMAISLNDVYVQQASASHLFQARRQIEAGLRHAGAAFFSVFSGATGVNDLPPYLVAAAAMESRAFPALTFDPSAGVDWASRFSLDGNSQVGADWPVRTFSYEDASHQAATQDLAFTVVDFIACDPRYGRHFARVSRHAWNNHLVPVADAATATGRSGTVPSILMVDTAHRLHKALVSEPMVREARRYRQMWHSLQELAGIHNSHVERHLARPPVPDVPGVPGVSAFAPSASADKPGVSAFAPGASADKPAVSSDDPYIDTPRCTTCNECTGVNNVMFAYNENKQAYVANPGAGTYAQLVEAAESCQVSIIHPGKPRNPDEPGLAELMTRAAPFL